MHAARPASSAHIRLAVRYRKLAVQSGVNQTRSPGENWLSERKSDTADEREKNEGSLSDDRHRHASNIPETLEEKTIRHTCYELRERKKERRENDGQASSSSDVRL